MALIAMIGNGRALADSRLSVVADFQGRQSAFWRLIRSPAASDSCLAVIPDAAGLVGGTFGLMA